MASSLVRRIVAAPLWMHAVALALVLVALMPIVGTHSEFSADEGAAIAQAHLLSDGHGWTTTHPFPAADPSGNAFPIELTEQRGDKYAPFVKHPLYALVLAAADKVRGRTAMVLLSVIGTWCAAVLCALIARRLDPQKWVALLALWVLGLVSPLVFDGYVLIAHSLGAAFVALAAWALVRAIDRRRVGVADVLIVGLATFIATLLRNEALLLAIGLTVGGVAVSLRLRLRPFFVLAFVPVVAGGLAHYLEPRWTNAIVGAGTGQTNPLGGTGTGGIGGRISAFIITWLMPADGADIGAILTLVAAVLVVVAAVLIVRKPEDREGPLVMLGAAVAIELVRLVVTPRIVPGLLVAFPLLVFAMIVARWRELWADSRVEALVLSASVFAILVLLTQYATGGSGEWGGRYFALGLPLIVPVAAVALSRLDLRIPSSTKTVALLVAASSLLLTGLAVRSLREYHADTARLVASVAQHAQRTPPGDGGKPVVVSSDGAMARFAVDELDDGRWLTLKVNDIGPYTERFRELGVDRFTLVSHKADDAGRVPNYRATAIDEPVPGWFVATLAAR